MAPTSTRDSMKLDIGNPTLPPDHCKNSFLSPSPPASPLGNWACSTDAGTTPPSQTIKDPVSRPKAEDHGHIIDRHLRARSPGTFASADPPAREDYMLALFFQSEIMKHSTTTKRGRMPKKRVRSTVDQQLGNDMGVTAVEPWSCITVRPIIAKKCQYRRAHRILSLESASRASRSSSNSTIICAESPARPPTRGPPNRGDRDFDSLPDYCPPLESMPKRPNSLKVGWKGHLIDLSGDANANLLHPDEVTLASSLRLDCGTYLTSKRRIFERRVQCLRDGKEFLKTDAQKACKIDVNKASLLWEAFNKVGWLDEAWVRPFL